MIAIDFFCGAGGLTRGLLDSGIKVLAGFDYDNSCKESYEFNNPKAIFINKDIRKIELDDLQKACKTTDFSKVLFSGCAPCQPFSTQTKGERDTKEATLLGAFGRMIEIAQPGYIIVENVPGITKVRGYSTFQRFISTLKKYNYKYAFEILNAKYFGVPQNRRRMILLASKYFQPVMPQGKYGTTLRPFRTVRDAISHYPRINAGETNTLFYNHTAASITSLNLERIQATKKDGGDRKSWPDKLKLKCHIGDYKGHTDVYGRMEWDKPSPALTGRCNSISNGRFGHPEQDRAISLREAAALQTFPDGYVFFGSSKSIAQQIGNAVPVKFAEEIAKELLYQSEQVVE